MLRFSFMAVVCSALLFMNSNAEAASVDVNLKAEVKGTTARVAVEAKAFGQKLKIAEAKVQYNGERVKIERKLGPIKFTVRFYYRGNEILVTVKAKDSITGKSAKGRATIRV